MCDVQALCPYSITVAGSHFNDIPPPQSKV
jgi:hypothetical protein